MLKRFMAAIVVAAALPLVVATTGAAQPSQNGLVNVAIVDNTVQIPIGVAANVCGVTVNLLASATATAPVDCEAVSTATSTAEVRGRGSNGRQNGLVNLYVANNTIQVPIGIAANICGVTANVLAAGTISGPASCDAEGNASAGG
jgi:hypothetical protein